MSTDDVVSVIQEIHSRKFENPQEFRIEVIQQLVEALGYSLENLHFDMKLPHSDGTVVRSDAVVAADLESKPYLGIEIKLHPEDTSHIDTGSYEVKNDEYGRRQHAMSQATKYFEGGVKRALVITSSYIYYRYFTNNVIGQIESSI